ncbi:YktB family protein [Tepidibacillus sp. LV47]|uniref:YktB family protein n=1 Tax=Tepidibacillus sp. LV47 TaxID=3398228 RepID=UPI003AB0D264
MEFRGFTSEDFDVFTINGLEPRMDAIKSRIRPKLEFIGKELTTYLSILTAEEIYYHVAKHARRTVNPPADTWVAWSANKRGYKAEPHFQVGLWQTHLFVWFAMIYEAPNKEAFGSRLKEHADEIIRIIPKNFVWSLDHTEPDVIPHQDVDVKYLMKMAERLEKVKKAEILCGINIDRNDPILQNEKQLMKKIEQTFEKVLPLYRLAKSKS